MSSSASGRSRRSDHSKESSSRRSKRGHRSSSRASTRGTKEKDTGRSDSKSGTPHTSSHSRNHSHNVASDFSNIVAKQNAEHEFEAEGLKIKYLPWTDEETEHLLNQLSFLEKKLDDDIHWISKEHVKEVERSVKHAMTKPGMLRRDDPLLENVSKMLRAIHLVDLDRLTKMMQKNQSAGNKMDGKDVLMLFGSTGAGKTTTLHFLSGTTFKEVEVDGFLHLHPCNFTDHALAEYKTSCDREASTRNIQVSHVRISGNDEDPKQEFVVCDVPAYDIANCVEEDIALGLGMVRALQRAKSIRPVLVLSREGMGNRFSNLSESLEKVTGMCAVFVKEDLESLSYIFTKYDEKHEQLLHKQFAALAKNPPLEQEGSELFKAFADDIATKTTPTANVVLPMEKKPEDLLENLIKQPVLSADTKDFFPPFVSEFSLKQLQLQLQIVVHDLTTNLFKEDYSGAIRRMHLINELATFFPEVVFYVKQGTDAFTRHVQQIWELVVLSIRVQDFGTALYRMEQLKKLAAEFPDAIKCSNQGQELLWESIAEPMGDKQYRKSIERMLQLNKLANRFLDAGEGVQLGFEALRGRMIKTIQEKEFAVAVDLVKHLSKVEHSMPEAFNVAQHGLHLLRESLLTLIEDENYAEGIRLTKQMSELGRVFPEANACVRRVVKTIGRRVEKSIGVEDYTQAEFLLENLRQLSVNLDDGSDCIEHAFECTAKHIWELRMEVVAAFEDLLKVKDDKKFSQVLELTMEVINALVRSEPLRQVCSDFFQSEYYKPADDKPNHVAILCTPESSTSDEFCSAQINHLAGHISADLPEFKEDETQDISTLFPLRNTLLSVMVRLKTTSNLLKEHTGGELAEEVYHRAFATFYSLIDGVLRVAEANFQSSMEMKTFELQAWFLAFLIEGFIKDKADVNTEQRKQMEELDHRRVKLMLRFENEIFDTMDVLETYDFPEVKRSEECTKGIKEYFEEVNLTELQAPRQLLLSLSSAPQLCRMLATKVDAERAKEPVAVLDKAVEKFCGQVVVYLEHAYIEMVAMLKFDGTNIKGAGKAATTLREDILFARREFSIVLNWSESVMKVEVESYCHRLNEIEFCLAGAIDKLQERLDYEQDIGVTAFLTSFLIKSIGLCGSKTDEDFSDATCSFLCRPRKEDFVGSLPALPPVAK